MALFPKLYRGQICNLDKDDQSDVIPGWPFLLDYFCCVNFLLEPNSFSIFECICSTSSTCVSTYIYMNMFRYRYLNLPNIRSVCPGRSAFLSGKGHTFWFKVENSQLSSYHHSCHESINFITKHESVSKPPQPAAAPSFSVSSNGRIKL